MTREDAKKRFEEENSDFQKTFERYGYQMSENEVIAIKEAIERNDMAIFALSAEGEYIKKRSAKSIILNRPNRREMIQALKELPTYSFPDREKGEWIEKRNKATGHIESVCSVCGAEESYPYNLFCPNCGADMRGKAK